MAAPAVQAGPASCPRCRKPLDLASVAPGVARCPSCGGSFEAVRFDPPQPRLRVVEMSATGPEASTACAEHPGNAAVANCTRCGVFMCALCATDADGAAVCTPCFERLSAEGTLRSAQTKFPDYASMASTAAAASFMFLVLGLGFGPLTIWYGVKALRQKREWGDEGGRGSVYLALVVGGLGTVAGATFLGLILLPVLRR